MSETDTTQVAWNSAVVAVSPTTASATENASGDIQLRLRRIEGQIRGIIGMLAEGQPCEAVVTQILAARAGMERVAAEVVKCHVADAFTADAPEQTRETVLRAITLLTKV